MKKMALASIGLSLAAAFAYAQDPFNDDLFTNQKVRHLEALAQPEVSTVANPYALDSLELHVFNSWTHTGRTLWLTPAGDVLLTISSHPPVPPKKIPARLTAEQKIKIGELWQGIVVPKGDRRTGHLVPDASTFKLTMTAHLRTAKDEREPLLIGSISGSLVPSSWSAEDRARLWPLVSYLSTLQKTLKSSMPPRLTIEEFQDAHAATIMGIRGVLAVRVYTRDPGRFPTVLQIVYSPSQRKQDIQSAVEAAVPEIKDYQVEYLVAATIRPLDL